MFESPFPGNFMSTFPVRYEKVLRRAHTKMRGKRSRPSRGRLMCTLAFMLAPSPQTEAKRVRLRQAHGSSLTRLRLACPLQAATPDTRSQRGAPNFPHNPNQLMVVAKTRQSTRQGCLFNFARWSDCPLALLARVSPRFTVGGSSARWVLCAQPPPKP